MTRIRLLLIGLILLLPTAAAAQPAVPALTPEQARTALQVLNNPHKRAELAATLEAIAIAGAAKPAPAAPPAAQPVPAPAKSAAPTQAAKPSSPAEALKIPLAPDSLGAQVLVSASGFLTRAGHQTVDALHAARDIPMVWGWAVLMATSPWARSLLIDTVWRLALVMVCALAVEYGLRRMIARPITALERMAPDGAMPPASADVEILPPEPPGEAPDEPEEEKPEDESPEATEARAEAGEIEPARHPQRRMLSSWTQLRRIPLVFARLLLDMVPVLGFLLMAHVLTATTLGGQAISQLVVLAVVDSFAVCIVVLSVARVLLSPARSRLRVFNLRDDIAAYLMRWTRRLVVIGVFGYAIAEVGLLLGLSNEGHEGVMKTVSLVLHICLAIMVVQKRRAVRARLRARVDATGFTVRLRNGLAASWHWIALFFIIGSWVVWAVEVPNGFAWVLRIFVITTLILIGARLGLIVMLGSIDRALHIAPEVAERYPGLESRVRVYAPIIHGAIRLALYLICVLALLQLYGLPTFYWFVGTALGQRVASACGTMLVTVLLALGVWEAANAAIHRHLAKLQKEAQFARSARLRTLLPLLRTSLFITIAVVAGLMVLSEIGVNIAPLLAGAGIVGVAIGFGSQKLVQDLITGIFLLLENAMQVGDWVTVSGLSGSVENLSVRTIRLRASDGSVHIIPFSAVTSVTNVNRGLGNAAVNVTVSFHEDTDRVAAVLKEIVIGMRKEPDFAGRMLSDLQLWGVDKVDGASVTILGQVVCTDSGRWPVQREFNRRMKLRFQELGIEIFNPVRSIAIVPGSEAARLEYEGDKVAPAH